MTCFAAIDFETANQSGTSACAVGVVIVEQGRIATRLYELIRPPSRLFAFTRIHGIGWDDVKDARSFDAVWNDIEREIAGVNFLAAHNAPFDKGVLGACCSSYRMPGVDLPFVCTVRLARAQWDIRPTRLPDVCRYLGIALRHHQADSDAEACARIVMAAEQEGWHYRAPSLG